jgi:uncharacterized membrane protein
MDLRRLDGNELIAMAGGLLLALGVFVGAYATSADNPAANIDGARGTLSIWDVHPTLRWLLLAAALAPFILAYVIARGHKLSWARGEMTAVVAVAAFGLVLYNTVIDRPGEPSGEIGLRIGVALAVLGTVLIFLGAALRSSETERRRKPPGVL